MSKEEAIEILSEMRSEYNIFGDEEEATRYHVLSWAIKEMNADRNVGKWEERIVEDSKYDPYGFFKRRWYCSACGKWQTHGATKYCPNCGSRMDLDGDTE